MVRKKTEEEVEVEVKKKPQYSDDLTVTVNRPKPTAYIGRDTPFALYGGGLSVDLDEVPSLIAKLAEAVKEA